MIKKEEKMSKKNGFLYSGLGTLKRAHREGA